jgi:hypothetical protein
MFYWTKMKSFQDHWIPYHRKLCENKIPDDPGGGDGNGERMLPFFPTKMKSLHIR